MTKRSTITPFDAAPDRVVAIKARLVELREIARRHGMIRVEILLRDDLCASAWDQASGIDRGGARKR